LILSKKYPTTQHTRFYLFWYAISVALASPRTLHHYGAWRLWSYSFKRTIKYIYAISCWNTDFCNCITVSFTIGTIKQYGST
jgi:hypothetical protein